MVSLVRVVYSRHRQLLILQSPVVTMCAVCCNVLHTVHIMCLYVSLIILRNTDCYRKEHEPGGICN